MWEDFQFDLYQTLHVPQSLRYDSCNIQWSHYNFTSVACEKSDWSSHATSCMNSVSIFSTGMFAKYFVLSLTWRKVLSATESRKKKQKLDVPLCTRLIQITKELLQNKTNEYWWVWLSTIKGLKFALARYPHDTKIWFCTKLWMICIPTGYWENFKQENIKRLIMISQ
jgi:hypothetical protein